MMEEQPASLGGSKHNIKRSLPWETLGKFIMGLLLDVLVQLTLGSHEAIVYSVLLCAECRMLPNGRNLAMSTW